MIKEFLQFVFIIILHDFQLWICWRAADDPLKGFLNGGRILLVFCDQFTGKYTRCFQHQGIVEHGKGLKWGIGPISGYFAKVPVAGIEYAHFWWGGGELNKGVETPSIKIIPFVLTVTGKFPPPRSRGLPKPGWLIRLPPRPADVPDQQPAAGENQITVVFGSKPQAGGTSGRAHVLPPVAS